jgi:membrane protease YdiL (CAAX protease family)
VLSLRRPLYGIFWFCIFAAGLLGLAGTALVLHGAAAGRDAQAVTAMMTAFLKNNLNTVALPLFIIVLIASAKGWLPGTKPAGAEIDKNDTGPRFGFSDALAIVVYLMVIQTGLEFLLGAAFELTGMPTMINTPAAHCTIGGLASIILVGFSLKSFRTSLAVMLRTISSNWLASPVILVLIAGNALIESEIDNMQKAYFQYSDILQKAMEDMLGQGFLSVFLLGFIAPVAEEIVFRGIVLKLFLDRLPASRAIVLSAIIFSLAHMDPIQMLPAFGSGLLLGWLYWETRNLWLCILFHSGHNLLSFAVYHNYLPFHLTGFTATSLNKIQFQPVWLDVFGICLLMAGIAAVRAIARKNEGVKAEI